MQFIDPLLIRINNLIEEGHSSPLTTGISHFGSQFDWECFETELIKLGKAERIIFIDFTPFPDEGLVDIEKNLQRILSKYTWFFPIIVTYSRSLLDRFLFFNDKFNIPMVFLDQSGNISGFNSFDQKNKSIYKKFKKQFVDNNSNIIDLRNSYSDEKLFNLLNETPNAIIDINNNSYFQTIIHEKNIKYLKMSNQMAVSKYILPKLLGEKNRNLTYIAYEIILRINNCFNPFINIYEEPPILLVVNNTSLYFASTVQLLLQTNLYIVDRLGPIPILSPPFNKLREKIFGKEVILIQDIRTTGGETDRAKIFLDQFLVEITKSIVIINLEAGRSKLIPDNKTESLCKPKEKLDYVYSSYFQSRQ